VNGFVISYFVIAAALICFFVGYIMKRREHGNGFADLPLALCVIGIILVFLFWPIAFAIAAGMGAAERTQNEDEKTAAAKWTRDRGGE